MDLPSHVHIYMQNCTYICTCLYLYRQYTDKILLSPLSLLYILHHCSLHVCLFTVILVFSFLFLFSLFFYYYYFLYHPKDSVRLCYVCHFLKFSLAIDWLWNSNTTCWNHVILMNECYVMYAIFSLSLAIDWLWKSNTGHLFILIRAQLKGM